MISISRKKHIFDLFTQTKLFNVLISGNLGLQAGSNTIRGLGTGHIMRGEFRKNIAREIKSGIISATLLAIIMWHY